MTLPLLTQSPPPRLPPVDALEDPASPPPHIRADASAAARISIESKLEEVRLTASDNALFGVYQDWVENTGTHLYGGIDNDGKWKVVWKNLFFFHPTL